MSTDERRVREIIAEELAKLAEAGRRSSGGVLVPDGWNCRQITRERRGQTPETVERIESTAGPKRIIETTLRRGQPRARGRT